MAKKAATGKDDKSKAKGTIGKGKVKSTLAKGKVKAKAKAKKDHTTKAPAAKSYVGARAGWAHYRG